MSTVHCGTGTAPNEVQQTLLALHRATVGTFGTATGNDNQVLDKLYLDAVFLTQLSFINPSETLSLYTQMISECCKLELGRKKLLGSILNTAQFAVKSRLCCCYGKERHMYSLPVIHGKHPLGVR